MNSWINSTEFLTFCAFRCRHFKLFAVGAKFCWNVVSTGSSAVVVWCVCLLAPPLNDTDADPGEKLMIEPIFVRNRPRHRRFEALTTDSKIIWLRSSTRRAVSDGDGAMFFSTAIATRIITAWLISLSISLKHDGTTSRLAYLIAVCRGKRSHLLTMPTRIIPSWTVAVYS